MYDMSLFLFPETQPRKSRWLVRSLLPAVARRAKAIITVSRSARDDILRVLGPLPEAVHVVYPAAAGGFRAEPGRADLDRARTRYGLDSPFILFVGTLEPRKNLPRLLNAFAAVRKRGRSEQLVLAGQLGWHYRGILDRIERCRAGDSIRLLGYVPPEDLPAIYRLARAVAFPSFYEGFGLPVIEAMSCGVPVLTSNLSSMAELGGGAAVLVDPYSEEEIGNGLFRLLTDNSLREELRQAGLERAAQFSWARAARETCEVYRLAMQGTCG
jgi:glycosyltransferase involved in cell wall biosynthesis